MDGWSVFNLVAGIASIAGGGFSLWQAKKSQSSAKRAQEVKDQIISHKSTMEMSELFTLCQKAQEKMSKFGPASFAKNLKGINPTVEAEAVQDFYVCLKQNRNLFGEAVPNIADELWEKLSASLEIFTHSKNETELCQFGKDLFILVVGFLPELKKNLDNLVAQTK